MKIDHYILLLLHGKCSLHYCYISREISKRTAAFTIRRFLSPGENYGSGGSANPRISTLIKPEVENMTCTRTIPPVLFGKTRRKQNMVLLCAVLILVSNRQLLLLPARTLNRVDADLPTPNVNSPSASSGDNHATQLLNRNGRHVAWPSRIYLPKYAKRGLILTPKRPQRNLGPEMLLIADWF
jgi:hypothetical protein